MQSRESIVRVDKIERAIERVNSLVEVSPLSRTSPVNRIWYHIYLAWQMRACESWLEAEQYLLL